MIRILITALALLLSIPAAAAPQIVFWDGFDGNTLSKQWLNGAERFPGYPAQETRFANGEHQQYLPSQARVENGLLNIYARPMTGEERVKWVDRVTDPKFKYSAADQKAMIKAGWVSGQISSYPNLPFAPGTILTFKLILPSGTALWPAAWAFESTNVTEIDAFEGNGATASDPKGNSSHAVHDFQAGYHNGCPKQTVATTGWHLYSADWSNPKLIRYLVDGKEVCSVPAGPRMTKPMFVMIGMAVGSSSPWIGLPDTTTPLTKFSVDWVKVEKP